MKSIKSNFFTYARFLAGVSLISLNTSYAQGKLSQTQKEIQAQTLNSWSVKQLTQCTKQLRTSPPHWVLPTGYDIEEDQAAKNSRNYLVGKQRQNQLAPFVVPKRSIVQLSPKAQDLLERGVRSDTLIGVRVLSVAPINEKLLQDDRSAVKDVATFREHIKGRSQAPQIASAGATGFLQLNDVEKVSDQKGYVFMVKRESPLFQFLSQEKSDTESFALQLQQRDGKFQVNECCGSVLNERRETVRVCRDFAIYKVIDLDRGQEVLLERPLEAMCEDCLLQHLIPMQKEFVRPLASLLSVIKSDSALKQIKSISQLNFVDSRGYVQIPVDPEDTDKESRKAPFGSVQYEPEKGNADLYLKPEVACGFTQALKTWQRKHCPNNSPDCRIEFGNASHATYSKNTLNKSAWPHASHDSGECMDIRPNFKVATTEGRTFGDSRFDETKFINMMNLFNQLGAAECYTSHQRMNRLFQSSAGCSFRADHNDHLHICFPLKQGSGLNRKLLDACQNGVK